MTTATRKPNRVNENHIQVTAWFKDEATYYQYAYQSFADRAAKQGTVTDREWVAAYVAPYEQDGSIEAVFRFKHTCKNRGAHETDAQRFFDNTRRRAFIAEDAAVVVGIDLLSRRIIDAA